MVGDALEPPCITDEAFLTKLAQLLKEVFGGPRFDSSEYLNWLYLLNPAGRYISAEHQEGGRVLAHYCVIPQDYVKDGVVLPAALSLNTAVSQDVRGRGFFTSLAERTYEVAREERRRVAILGVANANSTPGFCGRLRFKLLCPLPVVAGLRPPFVSTRNVRSLDGHRAIREGCLAAFLDDLTGSCYNGWIQLSSPEWLRWRLASPIGMYALHRSDAALAITTAGLYLGINVAIILRVLARRELSAKESSVLVAGACKFHAAPVFLHAGFNPRFHPTALSVPRRLLPSPLNLIYRPLDASAPRADEFHMDQFELLDFDAY